MIIIDIYVFMIDRYVFMIDRSGADRDEDKENNSSVGRRRNRVAIAEPVELRHVTSETAGLYIE